MSAGKQRSAGHVRYAATPAGAVERTERRAGRIVRRDMGPPSRENLPLVLEQMLTDATKSGVPIEA